GATINTSFRSGTNRFHLTAYEFLRNNVLNATGFFKPPQDKKPQFNRNQFGVTVGGPIIKNRAFFFLDYEGFRQVRGILATSTIATLNERNGILPTGVFNPFTGTFHPAGAQISVSEISPFARQVLANLPAPTNSAATNNYQILERFTN